ncbi:hypothetical protein TNCT_708551 [Trichonephila clavata]|uniref:Uncharacterized protein n=1 Tax=Trichonephila clavata TaxID=2740835 RepID=A0A8X6GCU0_TRICU|nr:hypothetical protein TNCT_708551 [Trichonephila clavata]
MDLYPRVTSGVPWLPVCLYPHPFFPLLRLGTTKRPVCLFVGSRLRKRWARDVENQKKRVSLCSLFVSSWSGIFKFLKPRFCHFVRWKCF